MATDTYAEWLRLLRRAQLGVTPTELHGSLTGFLCAGWGGRARELLASLALDAADDAHGADACALLDRAAARIAGRLRAREPAEILLPEGALEARANATVEWCRGFLGGLGLTGVLDGAAHTGELAVVLAKFGQLAATPLACDDDDEPTLADLHAFIRDAVARLHAALAPGARP